MVPVRLPVPVRVKFEVGAPVAALKDGLVFPAVVQERQRARQAGTSRNVIEERPSDASGLNDAIAALKRDTALPTNAPPEPAPAPSPALEEPEDEEGRYAAR